MKAVAPTFGECAFDTLMRGGVVTHREADAMKLEDWNALQFQVLSEGLRLREIDSGYVTTDYMPDAGCYSLPDGSCAGQGCMHDRAPR